LIEQKNLREKLKSFKRGKEYQDLGEPTFNELLIRESQSLESKLLQVRNKLLEMEKATDTSHFASDDEISNHFRVLANEQKAFENKIKNSLIEVRDEVNQVRIVVDDQKLKNANLADIIKQQDKELS